MASAKKCDRCGAFYVDNKAEHNRHITKGVAFIEANTWTRETWGYHDLCDDCQAKLDRFLAGCDLKEEKQSVRRACYTCVHRHKRVIENPCSTCTSPDYVNWERKEDKDDV